MSSYVESVLADGEKIVHRARISHWKFLHHYLVGGLFLFAGGGLLVTMGQTTLTEILAGVLALFGLAVILYAVVQRLTTELVLTDRRIITKRGVISRDTVEMNLSKVESLRVNQGLLGRILDYGDVTFVGTGVSSEPLRGIAGPLELRKKIGEVLGKTDDAVQPSSHAP